MLAVILSTLKWLKKYRNQVFINTIVSDNIPPKCPKKGVFINRFRSVSIGKQQHSGCRARHANLILMRFRWTPLTPPPLPLPSSSVGRQTWRRAAQRRRRGLKKLSRGCSVVRTDGRADGPWFVRFGGQLIRFGSRRTVGQFSAVAILIARSLFSKCQMGASLQFSYHAKYIALRKGASFEE